MTGNPVKDGATVTPEGRSLARVPAGVTFRDAATISDDRGSVVEMFDPRWGWHRDPMVFSYCFTVRPGVVKGWGVHRRHEDRYFILFGEVLVVLYDEREDSPTRGLVAKVVLSEHHRRLMNIPAGVWHADQNLGTTDAVLVNFPTIPYDHADPDKFRLPLVNDRIPYRFEGVRGG